MLRGLLTNEEFQTCVNRVRNCRQLQSLWAMCQALSIRADLLSPAYLEALTELQEPLVAKKFKPHDFDRQDCKGMDPTIVNQQQSGMDLGTCSLRLLRLGRTPGFALRIPS